jgi:hypothetical protein
VDIGQLALDLRDDALDTPPGQLPLLADLLSVALDLRPP